MARTLAALIAVGVALACVPLLKLPAFYESFLYLVFHWIVLATSWNILSYVLNPGATSVSNLDLKAMFHDAVSRGSINPHH